MLSIHHLRKSYNLQTVLDDVSFSISSGERIGLIGPNGCGKTTLMRILAGLEPPDSGTVVPTRSDLRIGYLAQGLEFSAGQTLASTLNRSGTDPARLEAQFSAAAAAVAVDPADERVQAEYDAALQRLSALARPPVEVLGPLGLAELGPDTPVEHLSGGQKTRLMLAGVLLEQPNLLLLDEPTNHLDLSMLEWLEHWLAGFNGAVLIVSHDRAFLDNTVTTMLELDPDTHGIRSYAGNYADYLEHKVSEREKQAQAWQDQQDEIAQLRAAAVHIRSLTRMKKGGKADGGDKFAKGFFGNRATRNVAGRATRLEARIDKLMTDERIEKPRQTWQIKLDFGAPKHESKDVLIARDLSIGYTAGQPVLRGLNLHIRAGQRIALVGSNGSGKTTLIRTAAGRLPPLDGEIKLGQSVKPGYMAQEQESLDPAKSALQTLQSAAPFNETEARNFLHYFLFADDDPLRPCGSLSFGERARLQLALLVAQGCTLLLLDEPINHLDIPSRARFEQALTRFRGTILAVVHDRYFIERFATQVWEVREGGVTPW